MNYTTEQERTLTLFTSRSYQIESHFVHIERSPANLEINPADLEYNPADLVEEITSIDKNSQT